MDHRKTLSNPRIRKREVATSLRDALDTGAARLERLPAARLNAELLLMRTIGCDRAFLLTHPDAPLTPQHLDQYRNWLERRAAHEPIQYITGEQEFFGLPMKVTRDVLIPRPETEHLVEALLMRANPDERLHIVDVGTGSGAIAIALAHALPRSQVTAVDRSQPALEVARQNAERHGVLRRIRFLQSDLLAGFEPESFNAVVSNPPYIANAEVLEPQVDKYEPHSALFAGPTGLETYQRLLPQARAVLKPGGWLMVEIGYGQQSALAKLLGDWESLSFAADLQGIPRVAIARR